jgi:hypothetical protein
LSSPEVDGRDERRKVLVVINPRYGLRNLAIKPVGDLANALHIAGESLSAQRAGDGKQNANPTLMSESGRSAALSQRLRTVWQ